MFYSVVERAQFGDVVAGRLERARLRSGKDLPRDDLRRLSPQQCVAVYALDPSVEATAFPELLITRNGVEQDWLAWLTAFAQTHRPFTAYCRILGAEHAQRRFDAQREDGPTLGRIGGGCVGLILGEILSSEDVLARLRDPLPAWACASTLSFALVREFALYRRSPGRQDVANRWVHLRSLARQRERGVDVAAVVDIISILEAVEERRRPPDLGFTPIGEVLQELLSGGADVAQHLFPALRHFATDVERDTREERVGKFEAAMRTMLDSDERHGAFVLGYLASRINPGTLLHAPLLAPALKRYPAVMLWYGVCAGLADPRAIMTAFGGLGRRAFRDVCVHQHLLERPRTDLSIEELEVFLRARPDDPPEFAVSSPTQLSVELDAGVWSIVNWSRGRPRRPTEEQQDDRVDRAAVARELAPIVHRLAEVYNRLCDREPPPRGSYERDPGPTQGTLPIDSTQKGDRPKKRRP